MGGGPRPEVEDPLASEAAPREGVLEIGVEVGGVPREGRDVGGRASA